MAWGEVHCLVGIAIYYAGQGNLAPAVPLAIASHWALDDLNVGSVARVYHGVGRKWRAVLTSVARVPIIAAIGWIFYHEPMTMACALPAWLVFDHEWVLNLFGRHGYGLHRRMWITWFYGELGLIPWFVVMALFVWLIIGRFV